MTRTMLTLIAALSLGLLTTVGASASMIPAAFSNLDGNVNHAWDRGQLTRGELDEVRALQNLADRVIRDAQRDGRVTPAETRRITDATDAAVLTFRRYRDNNNFRSAAVRPVVRTVVRPAPKHAVVVRHNHHPKPRVKVAVRPGRLHICVR
jgi:hypothetical protein